MRRLVLAVLFTTLAFATSASAQPFPHRPITIVVPFSAGGPSDAMARILAERMKITLGETVLVENVTGAGGSIGVGRAAKAPADGYTISFGHLGTHVANGAIYKLNYDLVGDLDPLVLLPSNPMIIVSKNAVPAKTLKELLDWLKARPSPASAGTAGAGSGSHVAGIAFEAATGIKLQFVPYRGTGPAMNDLVAGQIDLIVDQTSNSIQQVRAGNIRAYAIVDSKRVEPGAGNSDHRRSRAAWLPHDLVVGPVGAQGNAQGYHRQAECRRGRSAERSGGAKAVRKSGPADAAQGQADAAGAGRLAESRDRAAGGRSSRRPTSRWTDRDRSAHRVSVMAAPS